MRWSLLTRGVNVLLFSILFTYYIFGEKVAFIPYITAGDPDLSTTAEALKVLDACGSDIIELGVPYSDPLADGPVIQVWQFDCLVTFLLIEQLFSSSNFSGLSFISSNNSGCCHTCPSKRD